MTPAELEVLRAVDQGADCASDVARETGLSLSTVLTTAKALATAGHIEALNGRPWRVPGRDIPDLVTDDSQAKTAQNIPENIPRRCAPPAAPPALLPAPPAPPDRPAAPPAPRRPAPPRKAPAAAPKEARKVRAARRAEALDVFFKDMRRHAVLRGPEATAAAVEIARLEVAFWAHVLGRADAAALVRKAAAAALGGAGADPLPRRATAEQIRAADPDLDAQRAVLAALRAAPALQEAEGFAAYLRGAEAAARAVGVARERFLAGNLRLVVSIARRYTWSGMDLGDLIQEGCLGLMRALGRFEPERGVLFATLAHTAIRRTVYRSVQDRKQDVRLPNGLQYMQKGIGRARWEAENKALDEVSPEEIAREMGLPVEQVEKLQRHHGKTVSLDAPVNGESETTREELFIAPEAGPSPLDVLASADLRQKLDDLARRYLRPREREVVLRRFGFADGEGQTLDEIATAFDVTRECIRQIERKALAKLRRRVPREWDA